MTKVGRSSVAVAALTAAFMLVPASVAPAAADDFNPFAAPWQPRYYDYRNPWRPVRPGVYHGHKKRRPAKARRHRRHKKTRHSRREAPHKWQEAKGPYQLVVSIAKQQVAVYGQDGLIARAGTSTGMPGHPTPMGVFSVLSKARWHRSNIYSGAPMPYMQRITWSGIALHAGSRPGYPASHGCIRLPTDFAIRLFHTTKVGARVIVTRDPVAPVEIASPKLFVPKPPDDMTPPMTVAAATTSEEAVSLAARSFSAVKRSEAETSSVPDALDETEPAVEPALTTGSIPLPRQAPAGAKRLTGPVSVLVSLKQKRVFVRQGFHALFDMPVTIANPDKPIGTHIYTAMGLTEDGKAMRWNVTTIPSGYRQHRRSSRRHRHRKAEKVAETPAKASTAAEALDRFTLPPAAVERISGLLTPGSSLIVSDNRLSDEVDSSTNFIVFTR